MIKFAWGVLVGVYLILGIAWYHKEDVEVQEFECTDTSCENRERNIPDVESIPNMYNKSINGYNNV